MKLKGKVAIVTGASRGIGKAIALGFAREGAKVVVAARSEKVREGGIEGTIYKTAEEIQTLGQSAFPIKCDVTDEQSINEMVEKTMSKFGRIDILVNNSGIGFYSPTIETPLKHWELVLKVNLTGPFLCSKAVVPKMVEEKSGSIINISSLAANEKGEKTVPYGLVYAVSKAALDRFTWGLAEEVKPHNIAVNALKPQKVVETEGMRFWMPNADRSEWVTPEKLVKGAIFLAIQDSKRLTGLVTTEEELCSRYAL